MRRVRYHQVPYSVAYDMPRRYGLSSFIGDLFLTAVTGGAWLIWVIIREARRI